VTGPEIKQGKVDNGRSSAPSVGVADTEQAFGESAALLRAQYLKAGHISEEDDPCHPLEMDPSSVTFLVRNKAGQIVTRATLVLSGKDGYSDSLPCMEQKEFAQVVKHYRGLVGEVTRFAGIESSPRNIKLLMTEIAMLSIVRGVGRLYLVCHPDSESFYDEFFTAPVKARVDSYCGVKDKPGSLMEINTGDFEWNTIWKPAFYEHHHTAADYNKECERMEDLYIQRVQLKK
jgi:hypothetical protein